MKLETAGWISSNKVTEEELINAFKDEHHFQCTQELSKERVRSAFTKYFKRDDSWKTDFAWKPMESKPWWKFW